MSDFNRAIEINARMTRAYHGRAGIRKDQKYLIGAISDYSRVIELEPHLATAYANRGLVQLLLGKDAEAAQDFEQSIRLDPKISADVDQLIREARAILKRE